MHPAPVHRSMETPASLVAVSVQVSVTRPAVGVAARFVRSAGTSVGGAAALNAIRKYSPLSGPLPVWVRAMLPVGPMLGLI